MKVDKNTHVASIWKKIFKTILKDKSILIKMLLSVVFVTILDIGTPLLNEYALSHYFNTDASLNNYDTSTIFSIIYITVGILNGFGVFLFIYYADKLYVSCSYKLRKDAYEKLQELPFSYYDQTQQGWLMARMTSDSRKLANIISWTLVDMVWSILSMIGILVILIIVDFRLSLIVLAILPVMLFFTFFIRKYILKAHRKSREVNSQMTAMYNEGFSGMKTIKSLVIEDLNEKEFIDESRKYRKSSMRAIIFSSLMGPIMFFLGYVGVSLTIYFGGNMVLEGTILVGTLYLFIDYTVRFFDPLFVISHSFADFQNAQASAERIIGLIETKPEIIDSEEVVSKYGTLFNPMNENFEPLIGDVEFDNVTFKYSGGEEVLKNFSLKIKAGTSVALVGHTGSGKSTIVNLICRFYEPTEGKILVDGIDYKNRSIGWLHSNIGYVLQTPQLFSGTIEDNIRYGKLDASLEDVIEAAKIANAHEFIMKLEKGYQTDIGEGGSKLSLGQKQLISIARAIIGNPKLLILDEATSSVDTESEAKIQDAIIKIMKDKTTFSVAHRLSTIVNSDLILVLREGKIIEQGTHKELLNKKGYYFELYRNQFMNEIQNKTL